MIDEEQFRDLIRKEFKNELRRRLADDRERAVESYFEDLRRSGTLTRSTNATHAGWKFSHNSLREFLLTEHLLGGINSGTIVETSVPITDAMRIFLLSRGMEHTRILYQALTRRWGERTGQRGFGQLLVLLWDGIVKIFGQDADPVRACLETLSGGTPALNRISISRLRLSSEQVPTDLSGASFAAGEISDVDFSAGKYQSADFSEAILENVNFSSADLRKAKFNSSLLIDVSMPGTLVTDADFRGIDDSSSILIDPGEPGLPLERLEGAAATGYLKYNGASTDTVDPYLVYSNHPKFDIVDKICRKLHEQPLRQRRGLEQRGAAQQDVPFARSFVAHLEKSGLIATPGGRPDVISSTNKGRRVFSRFCEAQELPSEVEEFLKQAS